MTRKELEKFLRKADYNDLAQEAKAVAVSPTLRLLHQVLKASQRSQNVLIFLIPLYISWLSNNGFENLKHIFRKYFGFESGVLKPFHLENFLIIYFVTAVIYCLISLYYRGKSTWYYGMNHWDNVKIFFVKLVQRSEIADLDLVCSILWIFRDFLMPATQNEIDEIVTPFLLHLDDEEARKLPEDAKRWIRWRLKRGASPEFRIAGLLVLSSGGDRKVVSVARELQSDADGRVRMAADEALRVVEARRG